MVLVYSDDHKMMLELLHKGSELAKETQQKLIAVAVGHDSYANDFVQHGADVVVVVETSSPFKAEEYTYALETVVKEHHVDIILIGSNKNGKELAARLAATLHAGCVMDCTKLYLHEKKLTAERVVYSGNAIAVEQFTAGPMIATIPSKMYEPLPKNEHHKGEILRKTMEQIDSPSKILKVEERKSEGVNVEDAEIIVSCGRGLKKKEDIRLISELADVLKGRTVGCSRPIAADLKWL
ncbi:MAG TPA: electron transfer flavoprotein subunit alpha/FixB family protein, partial [Candidatus Thermoplasmatota archaeon]|nr:electron transfer flavoprotein subunit alpha/FixB family protein [Candidatus Thermoplasmatota archaeon]